MVTLVAVEEGQIVGFLDAQLHQPFDPMLRRLTYCYIADVAVAATQRSQGIGEQLMRAVEEWGREQHADFVSLAYNILNPRVQRFYARLGYAPASVAMLKQL